MWKVRSKLETIFLSAHIFYKIASNRRKGFLYKVYLSHWHLASGLGWIIKTWLIYQQTNTAHLIAISGLHIGLAMGIGFFFARLLQFVSPTRFISPWFPLCFGVLIALGYAYLAGFSLPTFSCNDGIAFYCNPSIFATILHAFANALFGGGISAFGWACLCHFRWVFGFQLVLLPAWLFGTDMFPYQSLNGDIKNLSGKSAVDFGLVSFAVWVVDFIHTHSAFLF